MAALKWIISPQFMRPAPIRSLQVRLFLDVQIMRQRSKRCVRRLRLFKIEMTDPAQNTPAYLATLVAKGCRHLPICRELVADFETPLSCYAKVARGPYSYLLESANQGGEKWSRFSIIGLPARRILRMRGDRLTLTENGALVRDE